jgi:hypothetical protein
MLKLMFLYCDMTAESRNSLTRRGAIARQRRGKTVSAATNQHATIDELWESVFSDQSQSYFMTGVLPPISSSWCQAS